MSVTKQNSMKLRLHLQAMQAKVDAANDKVATLERRLAVESGLLDEAIAERDNMAALIRRIAAYKTSTVRDRLIQDAVDYLVRTNNYGSLTRESEESARAAAAKGDKEQLAGDTYRDIQRARESAKEPK